MEPSPKLIKLGTIALPMTIKGGNAVTVMYGRFTVRSKNSLIKSRAALRLLQSWLFVGLLCRYPPRTIRPRASGPGGLRKQLSKLKCGKLFCARKNGDNSFEIFVNSCTLLKRSHRVLWRCPGLLTCSSRTSISLGNNDLELVLS
jgi:hypothetical protein